MPRPGPPSQEVQHGPTLEEVKAGERKKDGKIYARYARFKEIGVSDDSLYFWWVGGRNQEGERVDEEAVGRWGGREGGREGMFTCVLAR